MKNILILMSFGLSFFSFSKEDEKSEILKYAPPVRVIKDTIDKRVFKGKTLIIANFYYQVQLSPYEYEFRKCDSLQSAFYAVEGKNSIKIEANGTAKILIDTSITYIQFDKYKEKSILFETVYLENYTFKSQHVVEIDVFIPLKSSEMQIMVDKPVIYAYSETTLDFSLNLKAKGELTFTYPILPIDNTWKMKTCSNGNLINEKGAEYPYLFWEAKQNEASLKTANANSKELVLGKDIVSYFEFELSKLGLNAKEKTDFITYWCPKFVNCEMVQICFYIDENCSVIGDLDISPKPENFRRVYVTFDKNPVLVNDFVPKKLTVNPISRSGFTVIEWGGSEIFSDEL